MLTECIKASMRRIAETAITYRIRYGTEPDGKQLHFGDKMKKMYKNPVCILLLTFFLIWAGASGTVSASSQPETARPSVNGRLHVEGSQLTDASGEAVQLRGVSTHGLAWYPVFIN